MSRYEYLYATKCHLKRQFAWNVKSKGNISSVGRLINQIFILHPSRTKLSLGVIIVSTSRCVKSISHNNISSVRITLLCIYSKMWDYSTCILSAWSHSSKLWVKGWCLLTAAYLHMRNIMLWKENRKENFRRCMVAESQFRCCWRWTSLEIRLTFWHDRRYRKLGDIIQPLN